MTTATLPATERRVRDAILRTIATHGPQTRGSLRCYALYTHRLSIAETQAILDRMERAKEIAGANRRLGMRVECSRVYSLPQGKRA